MQPWKKEEERCVSLNVSALVLGLWTLVFVEPNRTIIGQNPSVESKTKT